MPHDINDVRAGWAYHALCAFVGETGCDMEDALSDLLCNLMHLCDREGDSIGQFGAQLARAEANYAWEVSDAGN